jgi:hypothetical protein
MNLSKIKEIFNSYDITKDPTTNKSMVGASRIEICNECESLHAINNTKIKICAECECVIKEMVFIKSKMDCPKRKWLI